MFCPLFWLTSSGGRSAPINLDNSKHFRPFLRIMNAFWSMALICLAGTSLFASTRVNGYVKKDGTYVAPHYRSDVDGNFYNNWSTKGNVNPYTGELGTRVTPPAGGYSLPPAITPRAYTGVPTRPSAYTFDSKLEINPTVSSSQVIQSNKEQINVLERSVRTAVKNSAIQSYQSELQSKETARMAERKAFWTQRGWNVDSVRYNSSFELDRVFSEAERLRERKIYWAAKGWDINSVSYSSSWEMDRIFGEAERIKERKAYWASKGWDINSVRYSSSWEMDRIFGEAQRMKERKAYWTARGWDVEKINVTDSYALDRLFTEAERIEKIKPQRNKN